MTDDMIEHRACHCCGLIHQMPCLASKQWAQCVRCGSRISTPAQGKRAASRTAAVAAAAFFLFWPAVLLPVLEIHRYGHRHAASILGGTIDLMRHGDWFVGGVVLIFSIVFPLTKLVLLLELSLLGVMHRRHKAITFRIMEYAGRWSMMDVLLLAFMVMLIKLGSLVEFRFGPAVIAFVACVVLSMMASLLFDPHSIWEESVEADANVLDSSRGRS